MGHEWTAKSFKSGNSVALRMPAALGIKPGEEWEIVKRGGDFIIRAKDQPKRKFNVAKVCGSATNLNLIDPDDRFFEERELYYPSSDKPA